ncbi:MAG: aminoacetone oxidase family FAD-binding enzyme [Elusimicrobiota bacterium]|jgi:predicted Rossmann fold flavoprotein|nr:aminoacetone oxidase family FAD-binding enzyme [Elusimicrobiota bacterium]
MQDNLADVIVIGGGASGITAALALARAGKKVIILEKDITLGHKILVSGNGRCNFTNAAVSPVKYYGDKNLIEAALKQFTVNDCLNFFADLGILYKEEDGRYFPITGKASTVVEAFLAALGEAGVDIRLKEEVNKIEFLPNKNIKITTQQAVFQASKIILACGSIAYPQAGGGEGGYKLAKMLGHTITPLSPALSALNLKEKAVARLAGLRVFAKVSLNGDSEEGEIIFGRSGVSGNNILSLSRNAKAGDKIYIDFLPQFSLEDFKTLILKRKAKMGERKLKDFLNGLLADNVANLLIDYLGLKKNEITKEIKADIFDRIIKTIKAWPFTVESLRPWKEVSAAKGGVDTNEIEPNTLRSKLVGNVFITGELLDIDGRCGGFNLHFAWASGFLAAKAIIKE